MVLKEDGNIWAWGNNYFGQCGDGTTGGIKSPRRVIGLTDVVFIAVGEGHSLAIKQDKTLWAWGANYCGSLGIGSMVDKNIPVQVNTMAGIRKVAAGTHNNLALRDDGTVFAWGLNHYGQLGDGTTVNRHSPVQVQGISNIINISAREAHNLAIEQNGVIWTWGSNLDRQLGEGTEAIRSSVPVQVQNIAGVKEIAAGGNFSMALKNDETVWCWGSNMYYELGSERIFYSKTPVQVVGLTGITAIDAGYGFGLALRSDKTVWGWGANYDGQLGDNSTRSRGRPMQVDLLTDVKIISAGGFHSMAVKQDGTLWVWGDNRFGQLGMPNLARSLVPIEFNGFGSFNQSRETELNCEAGESYLIALTATDLTGNLEELTFTINYDPQLLTPMYIHQNQPLGLGQVPGTNLVILNQSAGEIEGSLNKTITATQQWQGTIGVIKFVANDNGATTVGCRMSE